MKNNDVSLKINKVWSFIKLFIPYIIIYTLTIIPFLNIVKSINKPFLLNNKYYICLIILVIDTLLYFFLYTVNIDKTKKYFIAFMLIGFFYMIIIPLGKIPDEKTHFLRAYEVASGYILSDKGDNDGGGRDFTVNIDKVFESENGVNYKHEKQVLNLKENKDYMFYYFPNTALYIFVCYIPQALGIIIGKLLNLPILFIAYLGRLTNFLICSILIYFSLKLIPFKKKTLILLAFMPMLFQEIISLSPDALTISVAFLLISYILNIRYQKRSLKQLDFIFISILVVLMSLCKIVYLPLCLSVFLLPADCFNKKKNKYIYIIILLAITFLISLIWLGISSTYLNEIKDGVVPAQQLKYIITHPYGYISSAINSIIMYFDIYFLNIIGSYLLCFDVHVSPFMTILYSFIIFYSLIISSDDKIKMNDKILPSLILIATIGLIFTSLYIQWNPVASDYIDGIQGRYFIPLLPLLLVIFNNINIKVKNINFYYVINVAIVIINIYSLILIFVNHV